eukprot:Phypoly_transcript_06044.p1 GENE.Phypoly_transcript_06044~~Phypoly_transcript_06044.p1  ORF type:complete len:570 (+),score=104.72 Phypoly_transcript_06044:114-1823(+)
MSMGSSPKTASENRGACIGKAEEPCNVTEDNLSPDCYESMHAFKKIRTSTSGLRKSPNKWTKEENQKLASLVASYGEKKWKRISAEMGGQKTGAQCAQHWKRVLSPEIRKGHWDENEEDLLLRLVVQYGSCWKKIAKKIPQRTDIQCRYQYLKAKQSREVLWDAKEDESLLKKVMEMANCNFFLGDNTLSNAASDNSPSATTTSTAPLRNSSTYNTTPSSLLTNSTTSNSTDLPNKENDALSSGSEDEHKMKSSGECRRDAWNDNKQNVNMSDTGSNKDTGIPWRSVGKEAFSLSGTCSKCHSPVGAHINKIVWLEISEHMARLKLTSTLRTALECKSRFTELMGNKLSLLGSPPDFSLSSSSDSNKSFGLKSSGDFFENKGLGGFGNTLGGSGGIERGFHSNSLSDTHAGIKINHTNNNTNKMNTTTTTTSTSTATPNCNNNNINLTNCNNNNITINITNSYTTTNTNQNGVNFQQIAHGNSSHVKAEQPHTNSPPSIPAHLLSKTPILSPAPPFPSFSSYPHLPQPTTLKPASVRTMNVHMSGNGLESLAAVASILPREMLADYAHF